MHLGLGVDPRAPPDGTILRTARTIRGTLDRETYQVRRHLKNLIFMPDLRAGQLGSNRKTPHLYQTYGLDSWQATEKSAHQGQKTGRESFLLLLSENIRHSRENRNSIWPHKPDSVGSTPTSATRDVNAEERCYCRGRSWPVTTGVATNTKALHPNCSSVEKAGLYGWL